MSALKREMRKGLLKAIFNGVNETLGWVVLKVKSCCKEQKEGTSQFSLSKYYFY